MRLVFHLELTPELQLQEHLEKYIPRFSINNHHLAKGKTLYLRLGTTIITAAITMNKPITPTTTPMMIAVLKLLELQTFLVYTVVKKRFPTIVE